jgi:hypothetical protein
MGKVNLVAKGFLLALAFGAMTLLPQDAAARDHQRSFKQGHHHGQVARHGHHHGQVARFHAPPPKVLYFGRPHKRWHPPPRHRYLAPPGYRAWLHNPARFKHPRHHPGAWRWYHHRRGR